MMVRVLVMAAFVVFITPLIIAPLLGVDRAAYAANELVWTVISLGAGYLVAWPATRLISRSIKDGAK
jgi:predicted metal-binding membrane protein